jgi:flagellar assembly protein FliH
MSETIVRLAQLAERNSSFQPILRRLDAVSAPGPDVPDVDAFAQGFDEGQRVAADAHRAERDALLKLIAAADALQNEPSEELAALITDTVFQMVSQIVGTVSMDPEHVRQRAQAAVGLIAETDDARTLHTHPDDASLLAAANLPVMIVGDPDMNRGDMRIDCSDGWIEDGTALRLDALRAALGIVS